MRRIAWALLWLSLALTQAASAGLFYSAKNTTEGNDGSAADWTVRGWIDGENAKIEFESSANPMMPPGAYLLTNDGGRNVIMANPEEGTYSRWDIEAMLEMVGNVMDSSGGVVSMTIENPTVELLAEESGDEVAGRQTTYYRYRTSYDLKMKIIGMKRSQSTVSDQEVWTAELDDHPAFGVWLRKTPPSLGDSGLDELVKAETEKIKGFPLKMITESVSAGRKGRETRTRTVMEVTELREESIAADTFVLDPDLVETPMPMFGASPGEEEQEGGLRGLLKKRRRDG